MNWLYRIFNWRKSPKATNEIHPVDMSKYTMGLDPYKKHPDLNIKGFVFLKYWDIKDYWKKSPKNYLVWRNAEGELEIRNISSPKHSGECLGNLFFLHEQYYGEKDKNNNS